MQIWSMALATGTGDMIWRVAGVLKLGNYGTTGTDWQQGLVNVPMFHITLLLGIEYPTDIWRWCETPPQKRDIFQPLDNPTNLDKTGQSGVPLLNFHDFSPS